ncbi:MAG: tRNA lysidine(34) synthetase TilS [Anaerolineae bacterium]
MDPLAQELLSHLQDLISRLGLAEGDRLLVALSGGPDSLCLAHLLWTLRHRLGIAPVGAHLDHGIRPTSAAEASHVRRLCEAWGMPCTVERLDVPALAAEWEDSLEVAARRARYTFLARVARQERCRAIAVAHHADDQVETVLLRLFRGSGAKGLSGMRSVAPLDVAFDKNGARESQPLQLVRPLLTVSSDDIEAYCQRNGLVPIRDASNRDEGTPRNWLRHSVIPVIQGRVPSLAQSVTRTAEILVAEDDLIVQLTGEAWSRCLREASEQSVLLDLDALRKEHSALVRRLIRQAYVKVTGSLKDLGWRHVRAVEDLVADGHVGSVAMLPADVRAELGYDVLYVGRGDWSKARVWRPLLVGEEPLAFRWPGVVHPPRCDWRLEMRALSVDDLPGDWRRSSAPLLVRLDASLLPAELALRTRHPGDRLRPLGVGGTQSLQDLFVDRRIPRCLRERIPLLVAGETILWVVGCRLSSDAAITDRTTRVLELRVLHDDG